MKTVTRVVGTNLRSQSQISASDEAKHVREPVNPAKDIYFVSERYISHMIVADNPKIDIKVADNVGLIDSN